MMQNVNTLCVGAGLIGTGCAYPQLAAWRVVAVLGSPCPGSATAEAAPQASVLPKRFCLCFLLLCQEPAGCFVALFLRRGVGAASSMVQTCFLTVQVELRFRVALPSALF